MIHSAHYAVLFRQLACVYTALLIREAVHRPSTTVFHYLTIIPPTISDPPFKLTFLPYLLNE